MLRHIRSSMLKIPVKEAIFTANTEGNYSPSLSGRLGQQLLSSAMLAPPSSNRDQTLEEAANLLSLGAEANRSFWLDILQAKNLLVEYPQSELDQFLQQQERKPFFSELQQSRARLQEVIQQVKKKSLAWDSSLADKRRKTASSKPSNDRLFADELQTLSDLQNQALNMGNVGRSLQRDYRLYQDRLKEFLNAFESARKVGASLPDRAYFLANNELIKKKARRAQALSERVARLSNLMVQSGKAMSEIVASLQALCQGTSLNNGALASIEQVFNNSESMVNSDERLAEDMRILFLPVFVYP